MSGANLMPMIVQYGGPLWDFDFTTLSTGPHSASSFLSSTAVGNPRGLTFTRNSISTVQTSDSVVDGTPAIDDACIGCRDTTQANRGLVIQPSIKNTVVHSDAYTSWTHDATHGTYTAGAAAGPDGTMNGCLVQLNSGDYGNYHDFGSAVPYCLSAWYKAAGNSNGCNIEITTSGTDFAGIVSGSSSWHRAQLAFIPADASTRYRAIDARDFHTVGGQAAAACDMYTTLFQLEFQSKYATEFHYDITSGGRRFDDRLSHAVGSELISNNGQIKFRAIFTPKFSSAMKVHAWDQNGTADTANCPWYLFSWGTITGGGNENSAFFDSSNTLHVRLANGTAQTSSNAISFSQFDQVEIYVAAGSAVASVAKYRLNGGSWVDLVLGTISDVPAPGSNPVGIFMNQPFSTTGLTKQPAIWLHRLTFYNGNDAPAGV